MKEYKYYDRVLELATLAHGDQKRKYSDDMYITHPIAVAKILDDTFEVPEELIYAALLHDVIEDTTVTRSMLTIQLMMRFNDQKLAYRVVNLVTELTDVYTGEAYPGFNRRQRKLLEHDRIARISDEAKLIKLADLIHNTKSIVEEDPSFAKVYLKEKDHMLKEMMDARKSDTFTSEFVQLYELAKHHNKVS